MFGAHRPVDRLVEIARAYWAERPMELSAALSYYTLLSLAPLVLIAVAVAGLAFERTAVEGRIVTEMRALVGDDGAGVIETVLRHTSDPEKGVRSVVIGTVLLLVGATTVFVQLQSSLNRIWKVEPSPRAGLVWSFVKERSLSLAMVLGVGFLLLVSLVASAALTALGDTAELRIGEGRLALYVLKTLIPVAGITLLFAMIFKVLPDTHVAWRDVWFGAATTAVLFSLGKYVIGAYLGHAGIGSAYGAAGSLVVLTVWVYYASMIMFLGAELTYLKSRRTHPLT